QRPDDRVVHGCARALRPEEKRCEQKPEADARRAPLRPREAPGERERAKKHQQDARRNVAPPRERIAQCLLWQPALLRDITHGTAGLWIEERELKRAGEKPDAKDEHQEMGPEHPLTCPSHL